MFKRIVRFLWWFDQSDAHAVLGIILMVAVALLGKISNNLNVQLGFLTVACLYGYSVLIAACFRKPQDKD
jgi:hypothetical protein